MNVDQSDVVDQVAKMVSSVEQQLAAPTLILNQLDHLHRKTDRILDSHVEMVRLQGQHSEQLAEHIRRTRLLEEQLGPVRAHVSQIDGGVKLIGLISVISGVVIALYKLFNP